MAQRRWQWQATDPIGRMQKTYPGSADQLTEAVEYMPRDEEADVAVSVGVKWRSEPA